MAEPLTADRAQEIADGYVQRARQHKSQGRKHRRLAVREMEGLAEFRRRCEDLGIELVVRHSPRRTEP